MSNNDEKIIELKKKIEKKKLLYKDKKKFNPITSCIMDLQGERINLNVINDIEKLYELLIYLNIFRCSALNLQNEFNIQVDSNTFKVDGFGVGDWMSDVQQKIDVVKYNKELSLLNQKEKQLNQLLSDDKKTELELLEIENLLKGV